MNCRARRSINNMVDRVNRDLRNVCHEFWSVVHVGWLDHTHTELANHERNVNRNIHKYNAYRYGRPSHEYCGNLQLNHDIDSNTLSLCRKAASVLSKHPTRIRNGTDAKKLVSRTNMWRYCCSCVLALHPIKKNNFDKKARDITCCVFFFLLFLVLVFGFTAGFEFSTWFRRNARTNASQLYYHWGHLSIWLTLLYCTTYLFDGWMDVGVSMGCGLHGDVHRYLHAPL